MKLNGISEGGPTERLARFRAHLGESDVDAYWLVKKANVRYMSGFTGGDSTLLITDNRLLLITDSRYEEQAGQETEVDEVVVRKEAMTATVARVCAELGHPKIGFTAANVTYADGQELARTQPGRHVKPFSDAWVEDLRRSKDRNEIHAIGRAVKLAERSFEEFAEEVAPGRSENWLAGRLEWAMKQKGAAGAAFETVCAVDERASLPHARPTSRKTGHNSAVLLDWGARLSGYNSDLTRVLSTGRMPRQIIDISQVVRDAQKAAIAAIEPGVECSRVDRIARDVIGRGGYEGRFAHSLGHGLGLEVHEAPHLSARSDEQLKCGDVITVEPGIYLPGRAGVRIEDMVVVTRDGCELISSINSGVSERGE
ncbi:MAG: M24 family metallopeptidase [Candidatus Brocadiia bacterium]